MEHSKLKFVVDNLIEVCLICKFCYPINENILLSDGFLVCLYNYPVNKLLVTMLYGML